MASSIISSENAIPKPKNQPTGVFVVRTRLEILSVTTGERVPGTDDGMVDPLRASHAAASPPAAGISGFGLRTAAR